MRDFVCLADLDIRSVEICRKCPPILCLELILEYWDRRCHSVHLLSFCKWGLGLPNSYVLVLGGISHQLFNMWVKRPTYKYNKNPFFKFWYTGFIKVLLNFMKANLMSLGQWDNWHVWVGTYLWLHEIHWHTWHSVSSSQIQFDMKVKC